MKKILALLFLCSILAVVGSNAVAADSTVLTGKVRATVTRAPAAPFAGIVEEVLVKPGQHVTAGTPLIRYVLVDEARRALQKEVNLGAGTENLQAQVLDLQRQLAQAQAQRNKAGSLAASGLGSRQAYGRLEKEVASIESRIALTRETIAKSHDVFSARLEELSACFDEEISGGMTLPRTLSIKSPIDGYVLSVDVSAHHDAVFAKGFTPVLVGSMDPMLVQVPVYETDLASLKVGDKAIVEIPSLGNRVFEGKVTEIAWTPNDMSVSTASYYNVELTIPNSELLLKPGFKAVVRFTK